MPLNQKTWPILVAAILFTAGCIPSLHPLYTQQDVVSRDDILGRWTNSDRTQTWDFTAADDSAYQLALVDKDGREGAFVVRLTEIQDALFMDLYPIRDGGTQAGLYNLHLVSTHTFYRIELRKDALSLSFLNPQWLRKYQQENPDGLPHMAKDRSVVLTASTPQLRQFVANHLHTEGAFTDPYRLSKVGG